MTETGTNQGHPQGRGRAEVTGTEEITSFNLSTDTESDLSPTWRTKNFLQRLRTLKGPL